MDTLTSGNNGDKFDRILVELNDVTSLIEKYIDDEEIVRSFLKTLLINIDSKNNFLLYIKCNKDKFKKVINSNKLFTLYKYADLILSMSNIKQGSCNGYTRPENIESVNVISIAKEMGLSDKDIEIFFRKRLGEKVSIKDFITDNLREEMFNEYVRRFINSVNRDCKSSYCVAMKLSSLWDILRDRSDILDWDPKIYFRRALFREEVIENAIKWPIEYLDSDISKPHFKSLWNVKDIIVEWINMINFYKMNKKASVTAENKFREVKIERKRKKPNELLINKKKDIKKEIEYEEKKRKQEHRRRAAKRKGIVLVMVVALAIFLALYISSKGGLLEYLSPAQNIITSPLSLETAVPTDHTTHETQIHTTSTTKNMIYPYYYSLDLREYMQIAKANKEHIFIDKVPLYVEINNIPFEIYFSGEETYLSEVRVTNGSKVEILINPPKEASAIHLLTAMHYICEGHVRKGTVIAKIAVIHQDGSLEVFNITAGVNTDEWRKAYDSDKCHPYPWLSPALEGKMIYISVSGLRINSTWNIYYTRLELKNKSPIERIVILDVNNDRVGLSVYAITLQRDY